MARRVLPTERARAEIDERFASDRDLASMLEDVARLTVRLLMQTALEAEAEEFLGRARYQRRTEEHQAGSRNGWQPPTAVKTMMGPVELQRPKLRATDQVFCSRLFGAGVTRTNALESLAISGWVRGLSDRDIEASLAEVLGAEAALSKSTVSRICQRIRDEFQAWTTRDLSGVRLDYLFLDASHLQAAPRRAGRASPGRLGHRGRRQTGVRRPGTGGVGIHRRLGRLPRRPDRPRPGCPAAGHQRRRGRSDRRLRPGVPGQPAAAVPGPSRPQHPGQGLRPRPVPGEGRLLGLFDVGEARYPSAVARVTDDLASLTVHLRFPAEPWRRIRHSNFIERTFGETRRRTKVIGRLLGETTCLSLVWAVLDRASGGWRGLTMTPKGLRLLQDLRCQLLHPPIPKEVTDQAVTAAA